jgi:hypothetical protein
MNSHDLKCVHMKLQLPTKLFQLLKRDETCVATSPRQVCFLGLGWWAKEAILWIGSKVFALEHLQWWSCK